MPSDGGCITGGEPMQMNQKYIRHPTGRLALLLTFVRDDGARGILYPIDATTDVEVGV